MATLARRPRRWLNTFKALFALFMLGLVLQLIGGSSDGRSRDPVSASVVFLASPFLRLGAATHRQMEAAWGALFDVRRLEEENAALREALLSQKLDGSIERSRLALDSLTQEVSTNIPRGTYELIPVQVLSAPEASGRQVAWINAGADKGLSEGMIVLGPHGIAGEVDEVHAGTALVELITDAGSAWGAEVEGLGEMGLLRGTGDGETVEFQFRKTTTVAEISDVVVSTGMAGSIAPGGIPFGKVQEIRRSKDGEPIAVVRLPEEPGRIRTLFVLPMTRIPFKFGPVDD